MKYNNLIFDLDGTLWDSRKTLVENWNMVLSKRGLLKQNLVLDDMNKYMGLLIDDVLRDMFPHISNEIFDEIIDEIEKTESKSIIENGGILYKGVEESLRNFKKNHHLFIVSNCQDGYIEGFLKYFGFEEWFNDYESYGRTGKPKAENIKLIMDRNDLIGNETVYIGDTETDFYSAQLNQLDFIFCSYGFGQLETQDNIQRINELAELINYI